jgi:hypothetical protein
MRNNRQKIISHDKEKNMYVNRFSIPGDRNVPKKEMRSF